MSLVELIVALGLVSIVSIAIAMILDNVSQGQRKNLLFASLIQKKNQFQSVLDGDNTLANTIAAGPNTGMQCLRDRVTCDAGNVASAFSPYLNQVILYNNAPKPGAPFHDGRVISDKGFTEKGTECTGFSPNPTTGNDNCPVGYVVNWYISSAGNTKGISLTMTAKMIFNPSDSNKLKRLINSTLFTPLGPYDAFSTKSVNSLVDLSVASCNVSGINLFNGGNYPFYLTSSVPTGSRCTSELRLCSIINNVPTLSGSYTNAACVQNCDGAWGACSAPCGGGTQIYSQTIEANQWGAACATPNGATQACNTAACAPLINCVGSWGACVVGLRTYTITTPASGGGAACPTASGATQACTVPVDCVGAWGACVAPGIQTYTITSPASGGGATCPYASGATQACTCTGYVAVTYYNCVNPIIIWNTEDCGSGPISGSYPFVSSMCISPMGYGSCSYTNCSYTYVPTCSRMELQTIPCP